MDDKKIKLLYYIRRIVLIVLLLYVAMFFVWNFSSLNIDSVKRAMFDVKMAVSGRGVDSNRVSLSEEEDGVTEVFKDGLVYVTPTSLSVYSKDGYKYSSHRVSLVSGDIRTSDRFFLLFDRGGKRLYLCDSFNIIEEFESKDNIINAGVSDKGEVFVITEKYGHKASLTVYGRNFDKNNYYCWDTSDVYLTDAAFTGKNTLTVTGVNPLDTTFDTSVYRIDYKKGEILSSFKFKDCMAVSVLATENGTSQVLTTSSLIRVDGNGAESVYSFNGMDTDVFGQGERYSAITRVIQVSTHTEEVKLFDLDGNVRFTREFEGVKDVDTVGDTCYVLAGGVLYELDSYGNEVKTFEVPEASSIKANENVIFCIGADSAVCVK